MSIEQLKILCKNLVTQILLRMGNRRMRSGLQMYLHSPLYCPEHLSRGNRPSQNVELAKSMYPKIHLENFPSRGILYNFI